MAVASTISFVKTQEQKKVFGTIFGHWPNVWKNHKHSKIAHWVCFSDNTKTHTLLSGTMRVFFWKRKHKPLWVNTLCDIWSIGHWSWVIEMIMHRDHVLDLGQHHNQCSWTGVSFIFVLRKNWQIQKWNHENNDNPISNNTIGMTWKLCIKSKTLRQVKWNRL